MTRAGATRLAERMDRLVPQITYRRFATLAEMAGVRSRLCPSQPAKGALLPDGSSALLDRFDKGSNSYTIGAYLKNRLCGSVRVHVVSRDGNPESPSTEAFPHLLSGCVNRGDIIVDSDRLAVDRDAARACPELVYIVLRVPFIAAFHFEADLMTATVRPQHQAFFRRLGNLKSHDSGQRSAFHEAPSQLMTARFRLEMDEVLRNYPFFMPQYVERVTLFGVPRAEENNSPKLAYHGVM